MPVDVTCRQTVIKNSTTLKRALSRFRPQVIYGAMFSWEGHKTNKKTAIYIAHLIQNITLHPKSH